MSADAHIAYVLAYGDAVIASGLDPYRVGAWCRAHSDGSPVGLLAAVRVLAVRVPWELEQPEGPRDLRRWAAIAAEARQDVAPRKLETKVAA